MRLELSEVWFTANVREVKKEDPTNKRVEWDPVKISTLMGDEMIII